MSDSSPEDRTEAPTPRRRQDVADKGQGPQSREVMTAFLLLASAGALSAGGPALAGAAADVFLLSVSGLSAPSVGAVGSAAYVGAIGWHTIRSLMPIPLSLAGAALVVGAVQARGILTLEPLKPQWSRIDPLKKAKQIWGWTAVAELVKSLLKLGIVSMAGFLAVRGGFGEIMLLGQTSPAAILGFMSRYSVRLLMSVGGAYFIVALTDYAYQVWQHEKQIRMTPQEIKREVKDSEGDQVMKVRRRAIARQLARRQMLQSVAEADVVVTNPTHIAVALKYDPEVAHAPVVIALGGRKVAERIREIAKEAGVPIVENKPLARALFATAKVGATIPMDLFVAVAEILAFVYRTQGSKAYGYGGLR